MTFDFDWEVEIRVRRKGRLVQRESARAGNPVTALFLVSSDLERWAQDHQSARDANTTPDGPQ